VSEFAEFLPPSVGASSEAGEFAAFRPPVKKKEPPGITDRAGEAAMNVWDLVTGKKAGMATTPGGIMEPDAFGMVPLEDPGAAFAGAAASAVDFSKGIVQGLAAGGAAALTVPAAVISGKPELIPGAYQSVAEAAPMRPVWKAILSEGSEKYRQGINQVLSAPKIAGDVAAEAVFEKTGSPILAATTATLFEGAPIIVGGAKAFGRIPKPILESTWYRKLTIPERGLVLSSVDQMKASGMSEADIIRIRPEEWKKSYEARGGGKYATPPAETPAPSGTPSPGTAVAPPATISPKVKAQSPVPTAPPPEPPGATAAPEATPTPPKEPIVTPASSAAPGTPEFYKAEAAKLPGTVRYVGDQMGYPMFNDDTVAGSFMVKPEETIQDALARARARYETPQPTAETGPAAVPGPPIPEPLVNLPKEEPPTPEPTPLTKEASTVPELSGVQPPPPPEPPVQTPGEKFAKVRKEKAKAKAEAAEPTLQQRILRTGGIKIDPAMRGEFAQYGLRQGEGALARLYRSEKHPGYKRAMGWDQWVETLIEDGTLPKGAGISDLFEAIKKNKRPGTEIADEKFAEGFAKSQEKAAAETVPENEIAVGDSFRIDGEKFKAVRYNEKGNLIVKDGREIEVEANTGLRVDGGREGVTPVEIPKAAEEVPSPRFIVTNENMKKGSWKIVDSENPRNAIETGESKSVLQAGADRMNKEGKQPGISGSTPPKGQQDLIEDKSFKLAEEPAPEGTAGEFTPEAAGEQDELFPGERAKYREPEKGPPAPPPEGGLFAKGEEGFAPEADFRKKPGEPIDEGAPMSRSSIAKFLSEKFDIPLRVGRFRSALGIFKVGPEVIRIRFANDIEVISHEIGHALHKFLWPEARTGSGGLSAGPLRAFQSELIPIATKPRAGGSKNAEGFAEFIRRYIVDPEEAKKVAPKFYKFFEEELDAKSPDAKAILLKARRQYKAYFDQSGLKKLMSMISYGKDAKKEGVTTESLYRDGIDAYSEVETVVKEMSGAKKIDDVPANLNPYKKMHLMAGWKGKPDAWLEYKPYHYKTYKFYEGVKSFKEIYDPIKGKIKEFDAYRVAKRAQHLGFEKTGVANESVAEGLALGEINPELKVAFAEIKKYRTALNRYLLDAEVIDFETYVRWKKGIDEGDYSSFAREMGYESKGKGGGASFEVKGSPVHNFKGSWRDIISPTESDIRDTYAFINAAEKNAVGKSLVDLSKTREGLGKFVEKIPADTQRIAVKDTELEGMLRKYGKWTETTQFQTTEKVIRESIKDETGADIPAGERGTRIMKERAVEALKTRGYSEAEANTIVARIASAKNETARSRIIERVTERATVRNTVREFGIDIPEGLAYIYRKAPHTPKGNVITVMERGKPTFYEVDERIYNAFHALDKESANTLIRILSVPAKFLRIGATWTPEFSMGKNPIRDQWTAFINSKYGYVPGVDLARGLFTAVKKNKDYWRWKIGGGEHSAMVSMDREYFDKTWKEIMRDRGVKAEAIHVATHPIDVLRAMSEFSEEGTRLGEMGKGVKKELAAGKSLKTAIQDAAYASREVTLPFARMGAKTKSVNMIVAFWNANIADLDKIHRQFKEYPLQTSIRTMASITLPSVLLAIANHDDPDVKEIAQWQKDLFWIVPTDRYYTTGPWKGDRVILRIPKPFVMGIAFGSFPERVVEYIMDRDPRAFDGLLKSLSRGASPGFLPTITIPLIENWAGKSTFTGRPIVPRAREDVLPQYQYAPYTTETAKKIGGLLAKIPGIRGSSLEGQIVSPAKIENLIRGYTGGLGMWALNAVNASLKTAGIVPTRVEPSKHLADYPLIKAFVVRYPTADSESIQRFFDDYKEAEINVKSAKLLMKRGELTDASGILQKEEVARLVGVKTALTNAHRLVDLIYENPDILPEEKRRMIDETYLNMTAIAQEGNKVLDEYKKAQNP